MVDSPSPHIPEIFFDNFENLRSEKYGNLEVFEIWGQENQIELQVTGYREKEQFPVKIYKKLKNFLTQDNHKDRF